MLSTEEFASLIRSCLGRSLNEEQSRCISTPADSPLLIIAGPGTGKTTVLVLRALRHLLVDGIPPEGIVVTTFTKKAAKEVRTRWLDWGFPLLEAAKAHPAFLNAESRQWLEGVDLNHCTTGTLDSICEQLLGEFRPIGSVAPVLVEGFPANQLLVRHGLQGGYYGNKSELDSLLANYTFDQRAPRTLADVVATSRPIIDRLVHDLVDLEAYRLSTPDTNAKDVLATAYEQYRDLLEKRSQFDFALLEQRFLIWLQQGLLDGALGSWNALLVDEYQDTNPLQEAIYFEIVRRRQAALTVVGDDDQSLYRFRGATVELFTQFAPRLKAATGLASRSEYLTLNYRSTPEVVEFFNRFIDGDSDFASARIQPPKPMIRPDRGSLGIPVLGMFREHATVLARDLAQFIEDAFRNGGAPIHLPPGKGTISITGADPGGDVGDAVFLSHSVQEYGRSFMGNPPSERLPLMLRRELAGRDIRVFNPRGQGLSDQSNVRVLLGLIIECIDRSSPSFPEGERTPHLPLTNSVRSTLNLWRQAAHTFIASNPHPGGLLAFVDAWSKRESQTKGERWPDDWPLLELCFKLITWIPEFNSDPEHQVWLEAVSRAIAQARLFSPYGGSIRDRAPHDMRSRESIIRDVLRPIADGQLDLDEELVPSIPRDRFPLMTIHQAKGLEFPLVIVDVSSGFSRNHAAHAHARFPARASNVTKLEDDLAPFTEIGPARTARSAHDRTFDDLMRLYYVAYSRAQTALLLVGLEKSIATAGTVKSVATGWSRAGSWAWHVDCRPKPTFANQLPLVLL